MLIIKLLAALPLKIRILLGRTLGIIFSVFPTREKKIAELQLRLCLKENFRQSYLHLVYANLGQNILECLNLNPYLENLDSHFTCHNSELINKLKTSGRPVLILTGHTSNWDLLAAYAIKLGFSLSTIAKKARINKLQNILTAIRESYGIQTIWREDPRSSKEILKCLRGNILLAALIDQDIDSESEYADFFGIPAKYPSRLVTMAKKSSALIIAAFMFRTSYSRYQVYLHEINTEQDEKKILSEYSALLEKYIKMYPDQWVWIHKRWRSIEGGKRLSSAEYISYLSKRSVGE